MELEREQERRTYRLCQLGFGIISVALVLACAESLLFLPKLFRVRGVLHELFDTEFWRWADSPVVWLSLVGSYLLWGRWSAPGWQRRAGLLVVMGGVDVVLWLIEHGNELGLRTGEFSHDWLRVNIGSALGWAELALMASLACDVLVHLGVTQAAETGKATRSLAATGAVVWMLYFVQMTNWSKWPLRPVGLRPETLLLDLGSTMIFTITLIQVTALTIATQRQCGTVVREMDREDAENDPLRSHSERDMRFLAGFEGTPAEHSA